MRTSVCINMNEREMWIGVLSLSSVVHFFLFLNIVYEGAINIRHR